MLPSTPGADLTPSEDNGVGLSDSTLSQHRRKMLDLINRLHTTGVQTDMDLPMIAVIGSQSAGKSSLIESISGITLPRSAGTCTRCPTECKLSRSEDSWKCLVKLHITTGPSGQPCDVLTIPFGSPITDKADVEDRIRRAQRAILNPSTEPQKFLYELEDQTAEQAELSFSKNCVSLEISGKDVADLSFVDLPGLIASVGSAGKTGDIDLVKGLVTSYIERPSCVILLTVTCETDFENQGAHHLTKKHDPEGKRTVGVLTKPDRIPAGEESMWLKFIRNEQEPLVNHWYCVKQPGSQMLKDGISWAEARKEENNFFALTQPWSSMESQYQKFLRTSNLTERLSTILSELIAKRLPDIHKELYNILRKTRDEMRKLPKAPSTDPVGEVWSIVGQFSKQLFQRLEGTPDQDGILQTIRPHQEEFKRAVRGTAPRFIPWAKGEIRELPAIDFLANEEDEPQKSREGVPPMPTPRSATPQSGIYIEDVLNHAQRARTRELPDNYPFIVQETYIKEFTEKWETPSRILFDEVYDILKNDLSDLVHEHFEKMGRGGTLHSVLMIVNEHLDKAAKQAREKINWLLELEKAPTTLNVHYYSNYKIKFLGYYKGCRDREELTTKLQNYRAPTTMHTSPNHGQAFHQGIQKALTGLTEIGLSVQVGDLPKLLPVDPMEPALLIMAGVRAYFQVAYKRFADMVPLAIDYEIVRGLHKGMEQALLDGLSLTGPDAYVRCQLMVQEHSSVASKRTELQKKLDRLNAASLELRKLFV